MTNQTSLILAPDIGGLIYSIRDQRVILDADLAELYGLPTKRLNEQTKRNASRFPPDFRFRLTAEEAEWCRRSRSQIATLKRGQNIKYLPYAFTEHGALMAANILNSPRAVVMSVYVIRAFVRLREGLAANAAILKRLAEIDKALLVNDSALRDIYQKLRPLLEPPPPPPKPEIGFHVKEDAVPYRAKPRPRLRPTQRAVNAAPTDE